MVCALSTVEQICTFVRFNTQTVPLRLLLITEIRINGAVSTLFTCLMFNWKQEHKIFCPETEFMKYNFVEMSEFPDFRLLYGFLKT